MPGIIVFKRRWSIGSDDLIVPALILFTIHIVWLIVLSLVLVSGEKREWRLQCMIDLHEHIVGYIIILVGCLIVEFFIAWVSSRGTILETEPRSSMQYLLYVRLGVLCVEIFWLIMGVYWIRKHYDTCTPGFPRDAILGIVICNFLIIASVFITTWCTFDAAGRSWVKMQRYQNSLKDGQSKYRYKRSGNSHRNWRHRQTPDLISDLQRKAMRQYQDSWNRRCELLFCCLGKSDRRQNSFTEIAKLLSEFFRDLDVVPSDVIAGLILTRKQQKIQSQSVVRETANKTYQFLSGLPITPDTRFLDVTHYAVVQDIKTLIHYLHYSIAVYGWPIYLMENKALGCFQLCPYLRCSDCLPFPWSLTNPLCCCPCFSSSSSQHLKSTTANANPFIIGDNCCGCNYAALQKICQTHNSEIIYATYHVEIAEPPFFVALDWDKRTIVIAIRGTLSLQDVMTDLNAEGDLLPTNPIRDNWLGHKGMVEAAVYIKKKLADEKILERALTHAPSKGTHNFSLVLVGHSLGAGTAAILAILLKENYPDLVCYAFSPPGGLLSLPAVEYTKRFITSVVLGKDVVPRLGLHQMETLRFDLINAIKQSKDPKWKTIGLSFCCCSLDDPQETINSVKAEEISLGGEKELSAHPDDSSIALTVHQPLYPPGKIIHIVRNHPEKEEVKTNKNWRRIVGKSEPVYQALWVDNTEYDQIIISPVMIQDHMPDRVLESLEKLLINTGPPKPVRRAVNNTVDLISRPLLAYPSGTITPDSLDRTPSHRLVLETSFTDLQPVGLDLEDPKLFPPYSTINPANKYNRPTLLTALRKSRKVDLIRDDWIGMAPLASPEALSESSSISSRSACFKGIINGLSSNATNPNQVSSSNSFPVLEPIEQSPNSIKPQSDAQTNSTNEDNVTVHSDERDDDDNEDNCSHHQAPCSPFHLLSSPNGSGLDLDPNELFESLVRKYETRPSYHGEESITCDPSTNETNETNDNNNRECPSGASIRSNDPIVQLNDLNTEDGDHGRNGQFENRYENETRAEHRINIEGCETITISSENYCLSLSSMEDSQSSNENLPPLRRSHEEINLSCLEDDVPIFHEARNLPGTAVRGNDGNMSPKSRLLLQKLKAIESPNDELPACDVFRN